jgi:hypothetical protein
MDREFELPNSRFMTPQQQEEAVADLNESARRADELLIYLQPGETLVSRGDSGRGPGFRSLTVDLSAHPGSYSLSISYSDPVPPPPDQEMIQFGLSRGESREKQLERYERYKNEHLGNLESNVVVFEVQP